ncbi:sensor histidine kinase [Paenibacillus durus]|nr:HAMP domain-containing sensor histidine kinase [Paenibacillus durus]
MLEEAMEQVKMVGQNQEKTVRYSGLKSPVCVYGDREKLVTAIINILSNCIRYARACVAIEARTEAGNVIIRIADDGKGINPKDLPHIFERFYMGEDGHAGIGLAITKEIIEYHQGTVTAMNGENGAIFTIRLKTVKQKVSYPELPETG